MRLFARALLDELAVQASASPRGRAHYNIHTAPTELVQRFFVVANRDSYFRPHRHPARAELALVLRGAFDVFIFDDDGKLTARYGVGDAAAGMAFELPRATWHTLVAQIDGSAFLEVKQGPYDPASAAEFARWAPPEGAAAVPQFLHALRAAQPGAMLGGAR